MIARLANATTLVFLAIVGLVVLWIGSGMIGRDEGVSATTKADRTAPNVAVSVSLLEDTVRELRLYGDVEPNRVAMVRTRVEGVVEDIVRIGTVVAAGDVLATISSDDRDARRSRAIARLATTEQAAANAARLADRGVGPRTAVTTTEAELEAARAELRAVEIEIANTRITAPIDGVVGRVVTEIGSYASAGGEVIEIVDNDPLLAVVAVQQHEIANVSEGMPAQVGLVGGRTHEGRVSFVAPVADAATRTFRVEIAVENVASALPAGTSASVTIPVETLPAHYVSSALARLDTEGRLGVYVVDDWSRIRFVPIEIANADAGGIWITGPEDGARLVTISRGGLQPGELVRVEETPSDYEDGASAQADETPSTVEGPAAETAR